MIFYFSGTGNSRWVAESLGKRLGDAVEDIADVKIEKEEYTLPEGEILGFVFPVYAWAPPAIVMDFISLLRLSSAPKYVFFVCTCGDDSGKTADIFCKAIKEKGWECNAGFSVIMPNTYVSLPGFDVDPLHIVSKKLREAKERIEYISSKLAARARLIDCYEGAFPWIKSYLIHFLFMHTLMSPKPFKAADSCISCGLCEKACPVRNIHLKERGKPEWGSHCTMCLACYHSCPKHAIEYSCLTQKKGQYLFDKSNKGL